MVQPTASVDEHVRRYEVRRPDVVRAAGGLVQMLSALISDADVNCLSIDARAKEVASFRNKCLKTTAQGRAKYTVRSCCCCGKTRPPSGFRRSEAAGVR